MQYKTRFFSDVICSCSIPNLIFANTQRLRDHQLFSTGALKQLVLFYRMRASGLKGYQRESLGKSYQNGYYLKQAMQKSYSLTRFEKGRKHANHYALKLWPANVKTSQLNYYQLYSIVLLI